MNKQQVALTPKEHREKRLILVTYALLAASFVPLFLGLPLLFAIILAHLSRSNTTGPVAASHLRWLIRTFWYGLLWSFVGLAIGLITCFLLLTLLSTTSANLDDPALIDTLAVTVVLFAIPANFWMAYRTIKGLRQMIGNRPMYS